ncbi:DUF1934 domain-containing protein [Microaerobacter geothermalis]|uniref:DUF1934 domain-containing protein n=1 Tax=Microaerobacter geothermalis TaxID=674972 RepID=UPI001F2594C5|nr:DUF1934 domain-containing protein [Microaerobacter geothermalis]MCF6094098.1 DUF1934 domain-containing protein [Microaerobacter geothermalis]
MGNEHEIKVIVKVTQQNRNEQKIEGWLIQKAHSVYIRYPEKEMGETTTIIKLEEGKVTIIRMGEIKMKQIFQEGLESISYYETAYGIIELLVYTHFLRIEQQNRNHWKVFLDYDVSLNEGMKERKTIYIEVKEEAAP